MPIIVAFENYSDAVSIVMESARIIQSEFDPKLDFVVRVAESGYEFTVEPFGKLSQEWDPAVPAKTLMGSLRLKLLQDFLTLRNMTDDRGKGESFEAMAPQMQAEFACRKFNWK